RRLSRRADERAPAAPRRQPDGRRPLDRGAELQRAGVHPRPRRVLHRHDALSPVAVHVDRRVRPSRHRDDVVDPRLAQVQPRAPQGRGRAPAGDRAARQALSAAAAQRRAAAALVFNAFVWGTSWWPLRRLQDAGVHPLWSTALTFTLASLVIAAVRPRAIVQVLRTPALWLLVVAAGCTNAAFNWAIVIGDVVRVVLLFYLMPLWTVLLARVVLGERLTRVAAARIALGTLGALIVLWPDASHLDATAGVALPLPHSLADWLGIVGGFSFAFNNVM